MPLATQSEAHAYVAENRYFTKPVQWMVSKRIVDTKNPNCFRPDALVSRADTALFLWRMEQRPQAPQHPFRDVVGEEYNKAISWLHEAGISRGKENSTFAPNDTVSRAELAAFLHRLAGSPSITEHRFTDLTAVWQEQPVAWMSSTGIATGTSSTEFSPDEPLDYAQLATFLYRYAGSPPVASQPINSACNEFSTVSTGQHHSCALKMDGNLFCWGSNNFGESEPPAVRFISVSAGDGYSCGIGQDKSLHCWGKDEFNAPNGKFKSVSAGDYKACGVQLNNTLKCWPQQDPEIGIYSSVAAGANHICAITLNNTVDCWNDWDRSRTEVPQESTFASIDTGSDLASCGVTSDFTVVCWGANLDPFSNVPKGQFRSITVGSTHVCGLLNDATIECWGLGFYGQAKTPSGRFISVSTSDSRTCAVTITRNLRCWGFSYHASADVPSGAFSNVVLGTSHSCGIRPNKRVTCWGLNHRGQTYAPGDEFTDLAIGEQSTCGLRTNKTIICWGSNQDGQRNAPTGQFTTLSYGDFAYCGTRVDQSVACWGRDYSNSQDSPNGKFASILVRAKCGLRVDKTVFCWGQENEKQPYGISGEFATLQESFSGMCGLRTDQTVSCWDRQLDILSKSPSGRLTSIATSDFHACALRVNASVTCWGTNSAGSARSPRGKFSSITVGSNHSCALARGGEVSCWGFDYYDSQYSPNGRFRSVTAGGDHTCGIRVDRSVTCWGFAAPTIPPKSGTFISPFPDAPNPLECRPYGEPEVLTTGFPRWTSPPNLGLLRVAVLFTDFDDASADYSPETEAQYGLPYAEKYLESSSYNLIDVEFTPLNRWLRLQKDFRDYLGQAGGVQVMFEEVAQLALSDLALEDFDAVMVVLPSSHFVNGLAGHFGLTDDIQTPESLINTSFYEWPEERTPSEWGYIAAHELAHNLGLADIYDVNQTRAPTPEGWTKAEYGLMWLEVWLPPAHEEPHFADEMLAWSRWQLGWLTKEQVSCINTPDATVELSPVAQPGEGIAMAAIPISGYELIVLESRRQLGYDAEITDLARSTVLPPEGVLVYTVDSRVATGDLPIKGANESANGFNSELPFLIEGQSTIVAGHKITLITNNGSTHTVQISRLEPPPST